MYNNRSIAHLFIFYCVLSFIHFFFIIQSFFKIILLQLLNIDTQKP